MVIIWRKRCPGACDSEMGWERSVCVQRERASTAKCEWLVDPD